MNLYYDDTSDTTRLPWPWLNQGCITQAWVHGCWPATQVNSQHWWLQAADGRKPDFHPEVLFLGLRACSSRIPKRGLEPRGFRFTGCSRPPADPLILLPSRMHGYNIYINIYINIYMYVTWFIHMQKHTCTYTCTYMYMQIHIICTCIHTYMHTATAAGQQLVNRSGCWSAIHTYIHANIYMQIHTYIHIHIHAYLHTSIHAYMHTCIHACIYKYMHT